jgi:GGDEF domain-containing protein
MLKSKDSRKNLLILTEVIGIVAIISIIDLFFFQKNLESQKILVNPSHLFIFVVSLITIRYGMWWGIFSSTLVSLFYIFISINSSIEIHDFFSTMSALFIPTLVFGVIQAKYVNSFREQEKNIHEMEKREQQLLTDYAMTSFLKTDYERRILIQTAKLSEFYKDALELQDLTEEALYQKIIWLVHKYVEADKCSLYLVEDEALGLRASFGYEAAEERLQEKVAFYIEPYNTILKTHRVIDINDDIYNREPVSYTPIFSGPLKAKNGEILGVISVDVLSMLKFTTVNRKIFESLCDWGARAIENARMYRSCESRRIIRNDTGLYTYPYFKLRLEEALLSSKKTDTSFSLLVINIDKWDSVADSRKDATLKFISRIVQQNIREFDVLAHFERENQLAVLFPQLESDKMDRIVDKIEFQVRKFRFKPYEDETDLMLSLNRITGFSGKEAGDVTTILQMSENSSTS